MYRLSAKIEILSDRKWQIEHVTSVVITRDSDNVTDTCDITLPKCLKWDGSTEIPVKRGDAVRVWLGYDDNLQYAFSGYIRDVSTKTPVVIKCENEMFRLKQLPTIKKAYRSVNIDTLLKEQDIMCLTKVMGEQNLGQYRVTADTVASLLGQLRRSGVRSFFRYEDGSPVLYAGVLFDVGAAPSQVFRTGVNIIEDGNLEQQHADTMRVYVKAVSIMPDNKKIKIEIGDADGERRTIHTYNKTESELKAWAKQEIKRLKSDGLSGSFSTFGAKLVDKLDTIGIVLDGHKMGVYQVKKNVITYGSEGLRQEITLGMRVA